MSCKKDPEAIQGEVWEGLKNQIFDILLRSNTDENQAKAK